MTSNSELIKRFNTLAKSNSVQQSQYNKSAINGTDIYGDRNLISRQIKYTKSKNKDKNKIKQEEETILAVQALVTSLYFYFYSGSGRSGYPFSDITSSNVQNIAFDPDLGLLTGGLTYIFDPDTGLLNQRTGEPTIGVTTPKLPEDPFNSVKVGTTVIQNFGSESGYEEVGAQIVGDFIDHTGSTGIFESRSSGFFELEMAFSLDSRLYLAEWDIINPSTNNEVKPILEIDNKILELDNLLDLNKRAISLTYLLSVKNMQPLIDQALTAIYQARLANLPFSLNFGLSCEVAIEKFLEPKLDTVPQELPFIAATEEFFLLSSNMDSMKTKLQNFITSSNNLNVFQLELATVKCTSQKERADALQTFITEQGFANYIARTSLTTSNGGTLKWLYQRINWTTVASSPIEFELTFEDVPWSDDYGVGLIRVENEGYFLYTNVFASGIPFDRSQYDILYRWRKRGNTEWFSI